MRILKQSKGIGLFSVLYLCCVLLATISCSTDENELKPEPEQKYTLTLSINPENGGEVSGEGEYLEGKEVSVMASPGEYYKFINWLDEESNIVSEDSSFTFTMPDHNVTLTAELDKSLKYKIHFIDVGQGDAILITTHEKVLLVDGGWRTSNVAGYLSQQGIDEIDYVIATHPHADHIGGLIEVFNTYTIGEVIDPGVNHTTINYNDYLTAIDENDIPYTEGKKGMQRDLGKDAYFEILHPPDPIPNYSNSYLNNVSVVARVTLGEITVMLTGDIEKEGEADLVAATENLSAHILKVAHHGSHSSSTMEFLEAVEPEISIIMCGQNNQYGHPHQQTLDNLNDIGTEIYRTDIHGHIIINIFENEYEVITQNN